MTGNKAYNAINWTSDMIDFLSANFYLMTNKQLADELGLKLTCVRTKCYTLGLKRMDLEYWTEEQITFLKDNYKQIGDVEIAELFNSFYFKNKGWTKKHIEKKRRYLNLKRTASEIKNIHARNTDAGRFSVNHWKRWINRVSQPGETRLWRNSETGKLFQVIKTEKGFVHHARWLWVETYGPIAKGLNVIIKDGNPSNIVMNNLDLITDGELSALNAKKSSQGLSDNYIAGMLTHGKPELRQDIKRSPELIELKRKQLLLNRAINNYGKSQN